MAKINLRNKGNIILKTFKSAQSGEKPGVILKQSRSLYSWVSREYNTMGDGDQIMKFKLALMRLFV